MSERFYLTGSLTNLPIIIRDRHNNDALFLTFNNSDISLTVVALLIDLLNHLDRMNAL